MAMASNIPDKILDRIMERLSQATERGRASGYFKANDALGGLRGDLGKVNTGGFGAGVAGQLGSFAGGIQRFNQSNLGGAGVQNLMQGASAGLGAIGGAISANPWIAMGKEVVSLVGRFREWGSALHESNREFAEFSSSMATAIAESDTRNIMLKRQQGERRAETAKELAETRDRLNKNLAPFEDKLANTWNRFWSILGKNANKLIEGGQGEDDGEFRPQAGTMKRAEGHMWLYTIAQEEQMINDRRAKRLR